MADTDTVPVKIANPLLMQLAQDVKSGDPEDDSQRASSKFALFLGAGASISSGIIGTERMIGHFKKIIYERHGVEFPDEKKERAWLKSQEWYTKGGNEYSRLFEECYDTEPKRRSYIESIVEKAEPSFGYMVLANLIASGFFQTIVTTNFDDLVYNACTTYTSVRPVVYSLGGFATEMTLSSERPRILKLHGDFLYSDLKNVADELKNQDSNMTKEVERVLDEYDGIVVVGYGGDDASVMKLLEKIHPGKTLYWCYRKGSAPAKSIKDFVTGNGRHLVEIDGFDELMNFLRQYAGIKNRQLAKSFENNLRRLTELLFKFDDDSTVNFVDEMSKSITLFSLYTQGNKAIVESDHKEVAQIARKILELEPDNAISYNNLGAQLEKDPDHIKEAEEAYRKAIGLDPTYANAWCNLGALAAEDPGRAKEAEEAFRKAIEFDSSYANAWSNLGALMARDLDHPKEAEEAYGKAIEIDPSFARAWYNLGLLLAQYTDRAKEAEEAFRKAIDIQPDDAEAWFNLGALLVKDPDRAKEAEESFRKVIDIKPDDADAYLQLGFLLFYDRDRGGEAVTLLEEYLGRHPDNSDILLLITFILFTFDRKNEARPHLKKLNNLAAVLEDLKNDPRYIGLLKMAKPKKPSKKKGP
jgi:tetratricopeptide (TPR) repeat protein/NAD-dependent SIR2 family protein deacetylase